MNADNTVDRAISALFDAADVSRKLSATNPRHQDAQELLTPTSKNSATPTRYTPAS